MTSQEAKILWQYSSNITSQHIKQAKSYCKMYGNRCTLPDRCVDQADWHLAVMLPILKVNFNLNTIDIFDSDLVWRMQLMIIIG